MAILAYTTFFAPLSKETDVFFVVVHDRRHVFHIVPHGTDVGVRV